MSKHGHSTPHGAPTHSGHSKAGKHTGGHDEADGKKAVHGEWNEFDFDGGDEFEEGPTGYTGGGSNEKDD